MNGVFYRPDRKKWIAMFNKDKKRVHLGQFDTAEEAQAARDRAVKGHAEAVEEAKKAALGRNLDDPQPSGEGVQSGLGESGPPAPDNAEFPSRGSSS